MGKEILYRRSFHCDRDLKSSDFMLELGKVVENRKSNGNGRMKLADGGFEAPRNSLDVPVGGFAETRRHSEVRCEDIPIGYELSRSLTTRRKNEDSLFRKSMSSADSFLSKSIFSDEGNAEADQKPRSSNVIARLMGLDPLPHPDDMHTLQSSCHPSSRRLLPYEFFTPQSGPCTTNKQASISRVASQRDTGTSFIEESIPEKPRSYAELPFRNHPQEKQLQEFKREFTVHQQGKQLELCLSKVDTLGMHERVSQKEKAGFGRETLQESQEILDALNFLNSNKEFFVKVLKEPTSLFVKNLKHRDSVSSAHKEGLGLKESRLTRSFSESRKESYICPPVAHELADSRRQHWHDPNDKAHNVSVPHFKQDEHMPLQSHRRTHSTSSPFKTEYDQTIPTKIVVLKPKQGKHAHNQPPSPLSPLSHLDAVFKASEDAKECAKCNIKERYEQAVTKVPHRKDGLKDARDVARPIVKQLKDLSQRISSESCQSSDSASLARSGSKGRRLSPGKIGVFADATSDGEGYYSSPRRMTRDNVKANMSLPSSPRLTRTDSDCEYRPFAGNRGKGEKSSKISTSIINSRDARKDHVGVGRFSDVGNKNNGIRYLKVPASTRAGGSKDGKGATELSTKVLPRSLPAPAPAAPVKNRTVKHELEKGRSSIDRSVCVKNSRAAGKSLLKGKLLSLKDSFSLNKKGSKRQTYNAPSESWELSSPGQLTEDSTSDGSLEKCEQPSPISVFDPPFQELSPSPEQEIAGCHDASWKFSPLDLDYKKRLLGLHDALLSSSASLQSSFNSIAGEAPSECNGTSPPLGTLSMDHITCPSGAKEELVYIRDLFVFAGFTNKEPVTRAHAFSVEHGLNPSIFAKLESHYERISKRNTSFRSNGCTTPLNAVSRRMLYDVVNEILSKKRIEHTFQLDPQPFVQYPYTGKQLLEQVWAHIGYYRYACNSEEDSLDSLSSRELMKDAGWLHSSIDVQAVATELERLICGDLIREFVHEHVRL